MANDRLDARRWLSEARERLLNVVYGARQDAETAEEMRLHLELETERLLREDGLEPAEARRRAAVAFGGVEKHREAVRDARGVRWLSGMSLDFRLGFRMLIKYPGLTIVGGLAIAFAVMMGAGVFELVTQLIRPTLPLDEGDRIVAIRLLDAAAARVEPRALHDFAAWRETVESVEQLSAYRTIERNLVVGPDGGGEPVIAAEMSASGFRLARVAPLLGRFLTESDEAAGAAPVVVIGHDVWKTRFSGDADIIGRSVWLGSTQRTVVGVMPPGFAFPAFHGAWAPLRLNAQDYERGAGPALTRVFGRLAPGATLAAAQAELAALGRRAAVDYPATHEHLRPEVLPYPKSFMDVSGRATLALLSTNVFLLLFVVLVCGNVALLMFARAATRESELVVRTALGASRGRLVAQLFVEALVLGALAALVGLAAAHVGLGRGRSMLEALEGAVPFWFEGRVSSATVLYAGALTMFVALITGALPALRATRGLGPRMRQAAAGSGGLRFGGVWTVVIVTQVAVTVAFPVMTWFVRRDAVQLRTFDVGVPAAQYLTARLELDAEPEPGVSPDAARTALLRRFQATYDELQRRVAGEAGVAGVTFADRLPGMEHPNRRVEVDEGRAAADTSLDLRVSYAAVATNYFEVLGSPLLHGRGFHSGDLAEGARAVIVNESFVRHILGGRNALGRRVRFEPYAGARREGDGSSPWYEIIGVVPDLGMTTGGDPSFSGAGLYHPAAAGAAAPVHVAVHARGDAAGVAPAVRAAAAAVDPSLRVYDVMTLDQVPNAALREIAFWFRLLAMVSGLALLLSLAGIYAVMAYTVSRRTREIGIRVALGADARRVVATIFARPLAQVGAGAAVGGCLAALLVYAVLRDGMWPTGAGLVVLYSAVMMAVCLLACVGPTAKALQVEPVTAIKCD